MAIKKSKTLGSGVTVEYHMILDINISKQANHATVTLGSFINQEIRESGKSPVEVQGFSWIGEDNPFTVAAMDSQNPYVLAYSKVKATVPELADAVDC